MPDLELLRLDHAAALLAFELENRAYFAASVPDRGDDYFANFEARHRELLAEQDTGAIYMHLLMDGDGSVLGRFNLIDVADGSAELGFRVAAKAARRGLATAGVQRICTLARTEYGLISLRAAATLDNIGSRTVLERAGFAVTGETTLDGRPALTFARHVRLDRREGCGACG